MSASTYQIVPPSEQPDAVEAKQAASTLVDTALALVVIDQPSYERGIEIIAAIGGAQKSVEKEYRKLKDPIVAAGKAVDGFFRLPMDRLDAARRTLTSSVSAYRDQQERIRYEEERRIRLAQEAAQRKAEEDRRAAEALAREAEEKSRVAAASGDLLAEAEAAEEAEAASAVVSEANARSIEVASAPAVVPVAPPVAKTERTDSGARVTFAKRWVCEVLAPDAVPRGFCEPSQTKLNAAIRNGVRQIDGCRIYEQETARV